MAFLPALTSTQSAQIEKRMIKSRREVDKKSGYRVSLANINTTRSKDSCNVVARSPSDENDNRTVKQDRLPPLEDKKRNYAPKQSHNDEGRNISKPLKLPQCHNPVIAKKSMFWMEPLGVWVPLKQGRKLYEKFSNRIDLLYKDPDYFVDPCPHIPRCDHSRSWSAVKLEREKFRELRQLRNEQLLEKAINRHQNMQEYWLEQVKNRSEMLHTTPSHLRLQNFRKSTEGFLKPLDEAQRLQRLLERQREFEEARKLVRERWGKTCQKKSAWHLLPRIVVTDYEFILACDEHVNTSYKQSHVGYVEESYDVVCTPVQSISASDENLRTLSFTNLTQGMHKKEHKSTVCDPFAELESSEKEPANFDPSGRLASAETVHRDFETSAKLDPTDKIHGDFISGNSEDYPVVNDAGTSDGDGTKLSNASETNIEHDSLQATSHGISGARLDTLITTDTVMDTPAVSTVETRQAEGIKQADYTAHLMSPLVPVPLGVSSGKVPDQQLTASSTLDIYHTADRARLDNERQGTKGGAWLPRKHDVSPYLQIDLGYVATVQQVATQGNPASAVKKERHKRWVTKFCLEFSKDGEHWVEYQENGQLKVFTGNFDLDTPVLNSLENAVETRYIRFWPKEWHSGIAMRVEVFGLNPFPETNGVEETLKTPELEEEELDSQNAVENFRDENEHVKDEIIVEKQEVETFFREVDGSLENIQFGLSVEGRTVTPTILHLPLLSLVSPREQQVHINDCMDIHSCTQNLLVRDNTYNVSEAESSRLADVPDDSQETSADTEIVLSNSTSDVISLSADEKQEDHSPENREDESISAANDFLESDQLPTPQCDKITTPQHRTVTTSPPTPPPNESWVHALERARADGSIQQQQMREKIAEERRKKLAMLKSKRRNPNGEHTSFLYEEADELGDFLEKYCIIGKSDLMIYKNVFEKLDEDNDGFLWPEEVLQALENINSKLLMDSHLSYVFRVLEQCDCQADIGIGFRLFSVIAALSQRVAALNDRMKMLVSKCDFKTIDCTLERVKMLFECYVNEDTMRISRTDLWIGLAAGGLRTAEATIEDYFSEKQSFDFLDFLTYLPLFQEIHGYVVENPLSLF